MSALDVSKKTFSALDWKSYAVSRFDKAPLLAFVCKGLEIRGCRIIYASEADKAPFYIVFEMPSGERHGILVYAFFANAKSIRNRPADEHRFQIKYGGNLKGILEVAVDHHQLVTTLFLGIDTAERIFVAADPLMNTPAPMSRSIEFKRDHVVSNIERWVGDLGTRPSSWQIKRSSDGRD